MRVDNVVSEIVTSKLLGTEIGSSIIINISESYIEYSDKPLSCVEVENCRCNVVNFDDYKSIEYSTNTSFLFINRGGYFSCFTNHDHNPLYQVESEWEFTTNHDSCWRTNAYDIYKTKIGNIKSSLFVIAENQGLDNVCIPKHIIPNFSNISIGEIFTIEGSSNESKQYTKHILRNKVLLVK